MRELLERINEADNEKKKDVRRARRWPFAGPGLSGKVWTFGWPDACPNAKALFAPACCLCAVSCEQSFLDELELRPNSRCGEGRNLGFGSVGKMNAEFAVRRRLDSRFRPLGACCSRNVGATKNLKVKHRERTQPLLRFFAKDGRVRGKQRRRSSRETRQ